MIYLKVLHKRLCVNCLRTERSQNSETFLSSPFLTFPRLLHQWLPPRPPSLGSTSKAAQMASFPQEGCLPGVIAPFSLEELGQSHKAKQTPTVSGQPWAEIQEVRAIWAPLPTPPHQDQDSVYTGLRDAQPQTCQDRTLPIHHPVPLSPTLYSENGTPGVVQQDLLESKLIAGFLL